jgi:putative colanic acid biosynthesis UDP-glucose lipid carrier transferase
MEERVQKDVFYIENWSFWFDIKLIGMTALTMFIHDKKAY